jgi:hypothetical protein
VQLVAEINDAGRLILLLLLTEKDCATRIVTVSLRLCMATKE